MELDYRQVGALAAALIIGAGIALATASSYYGDQLAEQGQALEEVETALNETETAFEEYQDSVEDRMLELYDQRAELNETVNEQSEKIEELESERDALQAEVDSFVYPVDVGYETNYIVNTDLVTSEQNVEDSFEFTANEERESFNLTTEYDGDYISEVKIRSPAGDYTAGSIDIYDGNAKVGEVDDVTGHEGDDDYYKVTYEISTTDAIDEFEGTYTLEIEHDFNFDSDGEKDITFTAEGDEDYYIKLE